MPMNISNSQGGNNQQNAGMSNPQGNRRRPPNNANMPQGNSQSNGQPSGNRQVQGNGQPQGNRHMANMTPEQKAEYMRRMQQQKQMQMENSAIPDPAMHNAYAQAVRPRPNNGQQRQRQSTQQLNNTQFNNVTEKKGKKGKKGLIVVVIIIILIIAAVVGMNYYKNNIKPKGEMAVVDEATTGRGALNKMLAALNVYDPIQLDAIVGVEDGDSYLGQEWAYVNNVVLREEYLKKVGGLVTFTYPKVQAMSQGGTPMTDEAGNPIMIDAYMNNGESVTVTIPDYEKIKDLVEADKQTIENLVASAKYKPTDYTYNDELADLMFQWLDDLKDFPTKTVEVKFEIGMSNSVPYIKSDGEIDTLLFGSDEFHEVNKKFAQICVGYTGYRDELYIDKEEQHNPEYDQWAILFNQYYNEDGGHFRKGVSRWEPWYKRDANNNIIKDAAGNDIVEYYSIKKEDGTDWIQPDKVVLVDVQKTRQVEDPWIEETGILYNTIGTFFIQNLYTGIGSRVTRVGDGTKEHPAGIGTPIITKVLCDDGIYHDVKVAVIGYWTGQDAIDYAETFSTLNRGFTTDSPVKLITYEVQIENLESNDIVFTSEMTLCDDNSNISSRTGTLYGFSEKVSLPAHKTITINDWNCSVELPQKYVCWGKSFGRKYSMVYFDILAGTGVIPPYSAYEQFRGKGVLQKDGSVVKEDKNKLNTSATSAETSAATSGN